MIHVIWPTVRHAAAAKMAMLWYERQADKGGVDYWFGVNCSKGVNPYAALFEQDQFDLALDEFKALRDFGRSTKTGRGILMCSDQPKDRKGCTWTATKLSREIMSREKELHTNDMIVLASDDWEAPERWDEHINSFRETENVAIILNDGYAPDTNIIGLPVLTFHGLRALNGIIYNPVYRHMFSDQELYDIAREIGPCANLRGTGSPGFHHQHWSFNSARERDQHDANNTANWEADKATYYARASLSIEEKLKLPDFWKE